MPVYVYRVVEGKEGCPHCRESFDVLQAMSDTPVASCPECGQPVARIIAGCSFVRRLSTSPSARLTDDRLRKAGFAKLVKDDDGRYKDVTSKD